MWGKREIVVTHVSKVISTRERGIMSSFLLDTEKSNTSK